MIMKSKKNDGEIIKWSRIKPFLSPPSREKPPPPRFQGALLLLLLFKLLSLSSICCSNSSNSGVIWRCVACVIRNTSSWKEMSEWVSQWVKHTRAQVHTYTHKRTHTHKHTHTVPGNERRSLWARWGWLCRGIPGPDWDRETGNKHLPRRPTATS